MWKLDVRLVRTPADAVTAIVRHRNRPLALLLGELGSVSGREAVYEAA